MDDLKKSEFDNEIRAGDGVKDENPLSADEVAKILKERVFGTSPSPGTAEEKGETAGASGEIPKAEPPREEKPEKKPAEKKPAEGETLEKRPAEKKPAEEDPAGKKPAEEDPADKNPAEAESADAGTDTLEDAEESGERFRFPLTKIRFGGFRGPGAGRNGGEEDEEEDQEEDEEERPIRKLSEGALRIITWTIIAAAVVAGAFLIRLAVKKWNYRSLEVSAEQTVDNPVSSSYVPFGTGVLRYSADSATYIDGDHKSRWEITYSMAAPKADVSGERAVLYDSQGSDLVVCDTTGETNRLTTDLPVSRAVVSERGTVAAVMSDGSGTLIRYYGSQGSEISTIRTNMSDPGYPMGMSVSDDGMLLAVSYLSCADSTLQSEVSIYSFDSEGQTKLDNIVGKFQFEGVLIPEVRYLSGNTLAVFRDDGFTVIDGGSVPKIRSEVKTDSTIDSLFYSDRYIGYVLENDSDTKPFILNVFDLDGREMTRTAFSFPFETVGFSGTQISLYNRDRLCVYGIDGEKKFEGSCGESPNQFLATGTRQYVISDEKGIKWLRLG